MTFKEGMLADVKGTFLSNDEFSAYHDINGNLVLCQIDTSTLNTNTGSDAEPWYGVYLNAITIYADPMDLAPPVVDQIISVDKKDYVVKSVADEDGVLIITAEISES